MKERSNGSSGFLTTGQVGLLTGLSRWTVRRRCEEGRYEGAIRPEREGEQWRIPAKAIQSTNEETGEHLMGMYGDTLAELEQGAENVRATIEQAMANGNTTHADRMRRRLAGIEAEIREARR